MSRLENKIDFVLLVSVTDANPNGDPLNGNMPRETIDGYGEISDVCIKRKIRNRFQDLGEEIFVQSNGRENDEMKSLKDRFDSRKTDWKKGSKKIDESELGTLAAKTWIDVRAFGQVFAFKDADSSSGVSISVRGPVTIRTAISVTPIDIISTQITKSVNSENKKTKDSSTMGMKHRVGFGLYSIKGSVNVQLAKKTGFSKEDANLLKEALATLFENDASSARPEGSMEVCRLYWWEHESETPRISSAKIHRSIHIEAKTDTPKSFDDYMVEVESIDGIVPEIVV